MFKIRTPDGPGFFINRGAMDFCTFIISMPAKRFIIPLLLFFISRTNAQCTYSCSSYVLSPITHSMYPAAGDTLDLLDDEVTTTIPLYFNFDFYCNTYNQVRICSNGFITFDFSNIVNANTPYAQSLPTPTVPNAVIAWNWNDLDPSVGGTVTYTTIGVWPDQKFIVTWTDVPLWTPVNPPSTLLNTGQIVLHQSTNLIEIHVAKAVNNGWLTHTEGIEDHTGLNATVVPGRNLSLWTASLSSHMFSPYVISGSLSVSGTTTLCQGTPGAYITSTVNNAQGYLWDFPQGWSSAGQQPSITAIAGSSGNVSVSPIYTCGNGAASTLAVIVIPAPTVAVFSAGPGTLCSGTPFTLTASGAPNYTIQPGNITGTGVFTLFPVAPETFSISASNSQGCLSLNDATTAVLVNPSPSITVNSGSVCVGKSFVMNPSGSNNYTFSSVFPVVTPTPAGVHQFSVTSTGTNGCISAPAISVVTVAPLPALTITPDRPAICERETATLTASGAVSFTWSNSGAQSPSLQVKPPLTLSYSVTGTDGNGCVGGGYTVVVVDKCLSVIEHTKTSVRLFPNPAAEFLYVLSPVPAGYLITDITGRILDEGKLTGGENRLPVRQLPPGIYYIVIKSEKKAQSCTFVRSQF